MTLKVKRALDSRTVIAGSISVVTFLVYLSSLRNEFVEWDDREYVFANSVLRSLDVNFFKWAFLGFHVGNWHPLTWVSHAMDYALWGLNPMGHHLTNVILHTVNTFVVVLLVMRFLEAARGKILPEGASSFINDRTTLIAGAVTGLLFGIHPLHVESVAWVSERKDLLCALFFLLSIIAYTGYATPLSGNHNSPLPPLSLRGGGPKARGRYLLSLALFILALLSKPMAVTLPFVLLIMDWYPFGRMRTLRTSVTVLVEKLPFLALSLVCSALTVLAQKSGGGMEMMQVVPLSDRAAVAVQSLMVYLLKMLWPLNLVPYYPFPAHVSFFSPEYLVPAVLAAGITFTCIVVAKRGKLWLSVWAYYVITLVPVLGIVQVGGQSMADRYTYLPSLGPFLVLGVMAAWVPGRVITRERRRAGLNLVLGVLTIFVFGSLSYLTLQQAGIWKNSVDLWSYVIKKEPGRVPLAYNNRGLAFKDMGLVDRAIADFETVIALDPFHDSAYGNLGMLYGKAGMYDKAIEYSSYAIALNPNNAVYFNNRGGDYLQIGQYDRGLADYNKAIELNEGYAHAYFNRGLLYVRTGNRELAVQDFRKACDLGFVNGCAALQAQQ